MGAEQLKLITQPCAEVRAAPPFFYLHPTAIGNFSLRCFYLPGHIFLIKVPVGGMIFSLYIFHKFTCNISFSSLQIFNNQNEPFAAKATPSIN